MITSTSTAFILFKQQQNNKGGNTNQWFLHHPSGHAAAVPAMWPLLPPHAQSRTSVPSSSSSAGCPKTEASPRHGATMAQTAASGKASPAMEMGLSLRSSWHQKDLKGTSHRPRPPHWTVAHQSLTQLPFWWPSTGAHVL